MSGVLVLVGLVVVVMVVFVRLFRTRAQRALEQAGHRMPAELAQRRQTDAGLHYRAAGAAKGAPGPPAPATSVAAHFLLIYDVGPDFIAQRAQHRQEHLGLAWKAAGAGELVLAGALEEPTEQAFLLFKGSREAAIRFAQADPYVRHGLVKQWRVKQWHTVAGEGAATPVRPG